MDLNNFFYDKILQGFEIMGVNQKKIDRMLLLKESQRKYQDFLDDIDVKVIEDYFKIGLKANVFRDKSNHVLGIRDNLFWRFKKDGFQYLLCRRPLNFAGTDMNSIINDILQKKF